MGCTTQISATCLETGALCGHGWVAVNLQVTPWKQLGSVLPQPYPQACSAITCVWGHRFQMVSIMLPFIFYLFFFCCFVLLLQAAFGEELDCGLLSMPKLGWIIQWLVQDQTRTQYVCLDSLVLSLWINSHTHWSLLHPFINFKKAVKWAEVL